jgi:hypothetical protein
VTDERRHGHADHAKYDIREARHVGLLGIAKPHGPLPKRLRSGLSNHPRCAGTVPALEGSRGFHERASAVGDKEFGEVEDGYRVER